MGFVAFYTSLIPCVKFGSSYLGKATRATRAALPIPTSVYSIFPCPNNGVAAMARVCCLLLNVLRNVDACHCMLGVGGRAGCMGGGRERGGGEGGLRKQRKESLHLKVDSGRNKIPCRNGESNLRQYCARLFDPMLCDLSSPTTLSLQPLTKTPQPRFVLLLVHPVHSMSFFRLNLSPSIKEAAS